LTENLSSADRSTLRKQESLLIKWFSPKYTANSGTTLRYQRGPSAASGGLKAS
jgi:hypothetical protein